MKNVRQLRSGIMSRYRDHLYAVLTLHMGAGPATATDQATGNWRDVRENMAAYHKNRGEKDALVQTPRGRFELPRREAPVAFEATAFPG